jgi:hypothetical protein
MWSTVEKHNGHTGHCSGVMSPSLFYNVPHLYLHFLILTLVLALSFSYIQIDDDVEFRRIYKIHTPTIV